MFSMDRPIGGYIRPNHAVAERWVGRLYCFQHKPGHDEVSAWKRLIDQ